MPMNPLRLTAFCRGSHIEVVGRSRDALGSSGASISDFHMFSNAVLCLNFEIAARRLPVLAEAIAQADIRLDQRSLNDLGQVADTRGLVADESEPLVEGSLSINMINDEPVLRIEVPAVPG